MENDPFLERLTQGTGTRITTKYRCKACSKTCARERDYIRHLDGQQHALNGSLFLSDLAAQVRSPGRKLDTSPRSNSRKSQSREPSGVHFVEDRRKGLFVPDEASIDRERKRIRLAEDSELKVKMEHDGETGVDFDWGGFEGGGGGEADWDETEILPHFEESNREVYAAPIAIVPSQRPIRGLSAVALPGSSYFPFQTRNAFTSFLVNNPPNKNVSNADKQRIMVYGRTLSESNDIPSVEVQDTLVDNLFDEVKLFKPETRTLSSGHELTSLNPTDLVAADFANPSKRKVMQLYPVDNSNLPSDSFYHFKKIWNLPNSLQPPMVHVGSTSYFIGELALLQNGDEQLVVFLEQWYSDGSRLWGIARDALRSEDGAVRVREEEELRRFPISDLVIDVVQLKKRFMIGRILYHYRGEEVQLDFEHPLRSIARNRAVYSVGLMLTLDDFSGNSTTRWNCHYLITARDAALPAPLLQQRQNCLPLTATKVGTPHDLLEAFVDACEETIDNPREVLDSQTGKTVLVQCYVAIGGHDGPMCGVLCSHTPSGNATFACPRCGYGGSLAVKITPASLMELVRGGTTRTNESIKEELDRRARNEAWSNYSKNPQAFKMSGVRDSNQEMRLQEVRRRGDILYAASPWGESPDRTMVELAEIWLKFDSCANDRARDKLGKEWEESWERDGFAGMLKAIHEELAETFYRDSAYLRAEGFSAGQDTIKDVLHIVLLGVCKYKWQKLVATVKKAKVPIAPLLASCNTRGISVRKIEVGLYASRAGGLVGKDYKLLGQLGPILAAFLHHDGYISQELAEVWYAIGRLLPLIYVREISNKDEYLRRLRSAIDGVYLACFAEDPLEVLGKHKFHALGHILDDADRLGLPSNIDNESSESCNSLARARIRNSNRKDPEAKLSKGFGTTALIGFILDGGKWRDQAGVIRTAGQGVRESVRAGTADKLLGTESKERPPGTATFFKIHSAVTDVDHLPPLFEKIVDANDSGEFRHSLEELEFSIRRLRTVRSRRNEVLRDEDFVVCRDLNLEDTSAEIGRILEMFKLTWVDEGSPDQLVIVYQPWEVDDDAPAIGNVLVRAKPVEEERWFTISPSVDVAVIHVHHDCLRFNCSRSSPSSSTSQTLNHNNPDDGVLVNLATCNAFQLLDFFRPPDQSEFTQDDARRISRKLRTILERPDAKGGTKLVKPRKGSARAGVDKASQARKKGKPVSRGKGKEKAIQEEDEEAVEADEEMEEEEERDEANEAFEVVTEDEADARREAARRYSGIGANEGDSEDFDDDEFSGDERVSRRRGGSNEVSSILRALNRRIAQDASEGEAEEVDEVPRRRISSRTPKPSLKLREAIGVGSSTGRR